MVDTPEDGKPALQEFPLYYPATPQQFLDNGVHSGAAGAIAQVNIPLTNLPHMLFALRISNVFNTDDLALKKAIIDAGLEYEQTIEVSQAQQNITTGPTLQSHVTGTPATGQVWHPLPSPFGFTGTNNLQIKIRRLIPYPDGILPVAFVTLVCTVLNATNFAGTTPSGHVGGRRG